MRWPGQSPFRAGGNSEEARTVGAADGDEVILPGHGPIVRRRPGTGIILHGVRRHANLTGSMSGRKEYAGKRAEGISLATGPYAE